MGVENCSHRMSHLDLFFSSSTFGPHLARRTAACSEVSPLESTKVSRRTIAAGEVSSVGGLLSCALGRAECMRARISTSEMRRVAMMFFPASMSPTLVSSLLSPWPVATARREGLTYGDIDDESSYNGHPKLSVQHHSSRGIGVNGHITVMEYGRCNTWNTFCYFGHERER